VPWISRRGAMQGGRRRRCRRCRRCHRCLGCITCITDPAATCSWEISRRHCTPSARGRVRTSAHSPPWTSLPTGGWRQPGPGGQLQCTCSKHACTRAPAPCGAHTRGAGHLKPGDLCQRPRSVLVPLLRWQAARGGTSCIPATPCWRPAKHPHLPACLPGC